MRLKFSILPVFLLVFDGSAFAGAALPKVEVGRSVSARAMYGELSAPPKESRERRAEGIDKKEIFAHATVPSPVIPAHAGTPVPTDILMPRRPSGNLWAEDKDAPLRMPGAHEFAVLDNGFKLPEENLNIRPVAAPAPKYAAVQKTSVVARAPVSGPAIPMKAEAPVPIKVVDEDALNKAYEAGRIAELQRIADKALAERPVESKTRKLIVPMDGAPSYAKAAADKSPARGVTVRSTKSSPVVEEEFAYKNADDLPLTKLSPTELKRAFKKTYVSENKHLSAYKMEDGFDAPGGFESAALGFDSSRDLSEKGDIRPLEIKLAFRSEDSSLSRDNFTLLSEYAGIVVANPKRAVQISIPEHATRSFDGRKLMARRLSIVEQVLRDTGVSDHRIVPVLADRDDDALVLRVISNDVFQSLTQQRGKKTTTTKSLSW